MPLIVSIVDDIASSGAARCVSDYANERLELDGFATATIGVPPLEHRNETQEAEFDEAVGLLSISDGIIISLTAERRHSTLSAFLAVASAVIAPDAQMLPVVSFPGPNNHDEHRILREALQGVPNPQLPAVSLPASQVSRNACGAWIEGDEAAVLAKAVRRLARLSRAREETLATT